MGGQVLDPRSVLLQSPGGFYFVPPERIHEALALLQAISWCSTPFFFDLIALLSIKPTILSSLCLQSLQQMEGNLAVISAHSFKYSYWPIFTDVIAY